MPKLNLGFSSKIKAPQLKLELGKLSIKDVMQHKLHNFAKQGKFKGFGKRGL